MPLGGAGGEHISHASVVDALSRRFTASER